MTQKLTNDHKTVIKVLSEFHDKYQIHPSMRVLIKQLEAFWSKDKANSAYLYKLFPDGPIKEASKHAGLPPPLKCL